MTRKALLDRARKLLAKKSSERSFPLIEIIPPGQAHVPLKNALTIYLQTKNSRESLP